MTEPQGSGKKRVIINKRKTKWVDLICLRCLKRNRGCRSQDVRAMILFVCVLVNNKRCYQFVILVTAAVMLNQSSKPTSNTQTHVKSKFTGFIPSLSTISRWETLDRASCDVSFVSKKAHFSKLELIKSAITHLLSKKKKYSDYYIDYRHRHHHSHCSASVGISKHFVLGVSEIQKSKHTATGGVTRNAHKSNMKCRIF